MHSDAKRHALALLGVAVCVTAGWTWHYWSWIGGSTPVTVVNDAPMVLARIMIYATGAATPFVPNEIAELNAPFSALWSDYPTSELIYYPLGLLVRATDIATGTTLALLIAHLASGVSFYAVGLALRYRPLFVAAGAVLFALAPYAFYRSLGHVMLTLYWHVPLILLTTVWLAAPDKTVLSRRGGLAVGLATALASGLLMPYYCYAFVWLTGIVTASALVFRNRPQLSAGALFILVAGAGFVLQHIDTFLTWFEHGRNALAVERNLSGVLYYSLRLPELLFPMEHNWHYPGAAGHHLYYNRLPGGTIGETGMSYMGLVPIVGLTWLMIGDMLKIPAGRAADVSPWYWLSLATIAIAITGGITYLFAVAGLELFRSNNRFAIVLIAIALLFLCERASALLHGRRPWILAALVVAVGAWDQIPPPRNAAEVAAERVRFADDRAVAETLEADLAPRSMIFQLPVIGFPEEPRVHRMRPYEQLRLFVHAPALRYSFGQTKGRPDALWQRQVETLPVEEMVAALERYGFAALAINRNGFDDEARSLEARLASLGLEKVADRGDHLVFRLGPAADPELPPH